MSYVVEYRRLLRGQPNGDWITFPRIHPNRESAKYLIENVMIPFDMSLAKGSEGSSVEYHERKAVADDRNDWPSRDLRFH